MTILCVDDEELMMEEAVKLCRDIPQIDGAQGFTRPREALDWIKDHPVDIALLDICMPEMDGIELAAEIKRLSPYTAVIFLTGHPEYALRAFEVHAIGYLLKPVDRGRLAAEIAYALEGKRPRQTPHVEARTFGNFDLFVDGEPVRFKRAKCKELLAYLIDRHGGSVTRAEAFAILWEDRLYDRSMQKQFDVIIRSLKNTLEACGAADIFEMNRARMRIRPDRISCDAYRFFDADSAAVNAYRGEYMSNYAWASATEGYMSSRFSR